MFSFSIGEFVVDRDADADNRRVIYTLSGDEGLPLLLLQHTESSTIGAEES